MGLFRRGANVRDTDDATTADGGQDDAARDVTGAGDASADDATTGAAHAGDGDAVDDAGGAVAGTTGDVAGTPTEDAAADTDIADGTSADTPGAATEGVAAGATGTATGAATGTATGAAPGPTAGTAPGTAPVAAAGAPRRVVIRRPGGPWDESQVEGLGRRVDLGAIWMPGLVGMELRMEVDKKTNQVTGVGVTVAGSALQVQAFAAPRTEGIWDEIRAEIAESVTKQGGSVDELAGPFGRELLARLPVRTPEGRTGHRPARFIGHDGPRWFLRGVLTGAAAVDSQQASLLEVLFADIVVVRGTEARAPRDLLALRLPGQKRPAAPVPPGTTATPSLDPLTRGPEITETR